MYNLRIRGECEGCTRQVGYDHKGRVTMLPGSRCVSCDGVLHMDDTGLYCIRKTCERWGLITKVYHSNL